VSFEFEARLAGHKPTGILPASDGEEMSNAPAQSAASSLERASDRDALGDGTAFLAEQPLERAEPHGDERTAPRSLPDPGVVSEATTVSPRAPDLESDVAVEKAPTVVGASRPTDLKSLRARAWTLAARIAQRNGLGDLIQPLSGNGLGFILRDVPDPALVEQLAEDDLAQVSMVWWQLAACAEITVASVEHIVPLLERESVLRQALEERDADHLFDAVWTLDPGHTGYRLWRQLDARGWQDLLDLMDTYRALHATAAEAGISLWRVRA